jgi:GTP-binding protein HflX
MSQQGFGVLARGPGETKLETDRRRILDRISRIERDLKAASKHRATQRKARKRQSLPQVAIVGYTNAGKSTLLNALTDADVLVRDQLFATLDPTVRRLAHGKRWPIIAWWTALRRPALVKRGHHLFGKITQHFALHVGVMCHGVGPR